MLTDLDMPVIDGFEPADAIRRKGAESGRSRAPILALSANVMPGEAERCAAAGMDDFAGKPTSMPVLADKLRRWTPHIGWPSVSTPSPNDAPNAHVSAPRHIGVIDNVALDELTGGDAELAEAPAPDCRRHRGRGGKCGGSAEQSKGGARCGIGPSRRRPLVGQRNYPPPTGPSV